MTVQEQSSPRFEINPLPARDDPAGRAGRSSPPRPLFPAWTPRANPSLPTGARGESRCRHRPPVPPLRPCVCVGGKVKQLTSPTFLKICKHPPLLAQSWKMKFCSPRARRLGSGRSAMPYSALDPLTCPPDPCWDYSPFHPWHALLCCPPSAPRLLDIDV